LVSWVVPLFKAVFIRKSTEPLAFPALPQIAPVALSNPQYAKRLALEAPQKVTYNSLLDTNLKSATEVPVQSQTGLGKIKKN
jgi:hypothetical protein